MKYDDIINLPHFHDPKRRYMSNRDRAGQFMPFMSLKGYSEMLDEKDKQILEIEWEEVIVDDVDHNDRDPDQILDDGDDAWRYAGK